MPFGRLEPGPESLVSTSDSPPFMPPGWQIVPTLAVDGSQALMLCQRSGRRRASAAGIGVLAVVLWIWTGALALNDSIWQDRPWTWIMGAGAASATWMAIRRARITEAWQLSRGSLLIGETRGNAWHRPPCRVAALEVTPYEDDGHRYYRLRAVIPPGRRQTLHEGPSDDGSVQALGSWLAARADVPFTNDGG
jgi:hypothetical protein